MLGARQISDIYELRWSIEIQFRAFKQSCKLSRGLKHKNGFHHIEAMVLAAMLYQRLTNNVHTALSRKPEFLGWLSIEKTCDAISVHLMRLTIKPGTWVFDPDPRHLRSERRNRTNHW